MANFIDMVVVRANGEGVPVIFPVGADGLAVVSALRLFLRFNLKHDSIHVDEDIFDAESETLIHTIGQMSSSFGENILWNLRPGQYRAYGVTTVVESNPVQTQCLPRSSFSTFQTPLLSNVKVESSANMVTVLSSDSEGSSPIPCSNIVKTPSLVEFVPTASVLKPVGTPDFGVLDDSRKSVVDCLRGLHTLKGCRNVLAKLDYGNIQIHKVTVLPPTFNGDVIFELPAADSSGTFSSAKQMSGIDKRYDGHVWSKTVTTNIVNSMGLSFRKLVCLGHLRCVNAECQFLSRVHRTNEVNELEWEGVSPIAFDVGQPHPASSTLVCKICMEPSACIARCTMQVYYVIGNFTLSRAYVHLGTHEHPVKDGELRDMQATTRSLIGEQLERTPSATNSAVILEATKELLGGLLLCPDGELPKTMDLAALVPVFDKCKYLSSPSIQNEVTSFKFLRKFGVIDSITRFRGSSTWAFV